MFKRFAVSRAIIAVPLPVAAFLPSDPPNSTGLPVTIPGVCPLIMPYSSINHAIICGFVFTSGAGISLFTPIIGLIARKKRLDSLSNSREDNLDGSTEIPPLPPPYGISTKAVFQVIKAARDRTSSRSTSS